jgi:hypothetical protein
MSTKVKTEKVTLYRVTWPAAGETWAEQRIVVLDDVDKNQMYYRQPTLSDVSYEQRHRLAARQAMGFYARRPGETDRMSHAEARKHGIFETADDAKRWVWETLQILTRADRTTSHLSLNGLNKHDSSRLWQRPWKHLPDDVTAWLADFASAVDGLKVWAGE